MALGHVHYAGHRSTRTCYDLAWKAGRLWVAWGCQGIWVQRPRLEETGCQATYCKHTAQGSPNRLTCTVTIVLTAAHHSYIHIPYTHTLHTLRGLCIGPKLSGLSTVYRLTYWPLLLRSPPTPMVQCNTIH